MLHTISWQGYWTAIAILSGVYYIVIYLVYFPKDVKIFSTPTSPKLYSAKKGLGDQRLMETSVNNHTLFAENIVSEFTLPTENTIEHLVYSCMDEVNAFFDQAKRKKWLKNDLIHSLRSLLNKYPPLRNSEYRESISNVLVTECQHNCSVHLDEGDVVHVWLA